MTGSVPAMRIDNFYVAGGHPQAEKQSISTAVENDRQVKTSAGQLVRVEGYTATSQYLQVHDSATTPAEGAVPLWSIAIAATWNFNEVLEHLQFANGIYVCVSTTQATKTLGANDTWFNITYR